MIKDKKALEAKRVIRNSAPDGIIGNRNLLKYIRADIYVRAREWADEALADMLEYGGEMTVLSENIVSAFCFFSHAALLKYTDYDWMTNTYRLHRKRT